MTRLARHIAGLILLLLAIGLVLSWPIAPSAFAIPALGLVMALLAGAAWRWPGSLLLLLPAAALLIDASPWTGWLFTGEQDIACLVLLGALLLRGPIPHPGLSRTSWVVLGAMTATTLIAALIGLTVPAPPGGSDLVYLSPLNSLRTAKPWLEVMALTPWIADAMRNRQGGRMLAAGMMLLGLGIAASAALERAAFATMFGMSSDYRVTGTFNSMHVGGGHIGAALALVLPFAVAGFALRLRVMAALLLPAILYALVVTFARAAYAAALAAVLVMALAGLWQGRRRLRRVVLPGLLVLGLAGGVAAAFDLPFMAARLALVHDDLAFRAENWRHSLDLHDSSPIAWAFGEGLGTYPRLSAAVSPPTDGPSWYVVAKSETPHLTLVSRLPFFLGHRVPVSAIGQPLDLSFSWRPHQVDPGAAPPVAVQGHVGALLCEKLLLYSMDCAQAPSSQAAPGQWTQVSAHLRPVGDKNRPIPRLLELSFATDPGAIIDLADVSLRDPAGRELISNGDFHAGATSWFITDDHHWIWRVFDQFLTTLLESGVLGLLVWLALLGSTFRQGLRATEGRQVWQNAAFAGAVAAICVNSLFDAILEAPRLALVINLVLTAGLLSNPIFLPAKTPEAPQP